MIDDHDELVQTGGCCDERDVDEIHVAKEWSFDEAIATSATWMRTMQGPSFFINPKVLGNVVGN